jgi:purine-nucleoside phosphorylase
MMHTPLAAQLAASTDYVRSKVTTLPRVGLVLGSGLGAFADSLSALVKIPYAEIPHFSASTVVGHSGNLCFGQVGHVNVVCMQGRVHAYEGHDQAAVVHGVRTMAQLGAQTILITNAAGGLDPTWSPGDLMLVTDHLNLTGTSPLIGANAYTLGPRFPDMGKAYDPEVNAALRGVARALGHELREGVYAGLLGPTYETPAEVRMLRGFGAHAVGMSTVGEVIALRHMGVRVGALSCITNLAAGILDQPLNHAEVEATAKAKRQVLLDLLTGWIKAIGGAK